MDVTGSNLQKGGRSGWRQGELLPIPKKSFKIYRREIHQNTRGMKKKLQFSKTKLIGVLLLLKYFGLSRNNFAFNGFVLSSTAYFRLSLHLELLQNLRTKTNILLFPAVISSITSRCHLSFKSSFSPFALECCSE